MSTAFYYINLNCTKKYFQKSNKFVRNLKHKTHECEKHAREGSADSLHSSTRYTEQTDMHIYPSWYFFMNLLRRENEKQHLHVTIKTARVFLSIWEIMKQICVIHWRFRFRSFCITILIIYIVRVVTSLNLIPCTVNYFGGGRWICRCKRKLILPGKTIPPCNFDAWAFKNYCTCEVLFL